MRRHYTSPSLRSLLSSLPAAELPVSADMPIPDVLTVIRARYEHIAFAVEVSDEAYGALVYVAGPDLVRDPLDSHIVDHLGVMGSRSCVLVEDGLAIAAYNLPRLNLPISPAATRLAAAQAFLDGLPSGDDGFPARAVLVALAQSEGGAAVPDAGLVARGVECLMSLPAGQRASVPFFKVMRILLGSGMESVIEGWKHLHPIRSAS